MKKLILFGGILLLVGCANSPIVDFMGDKYYFNVEYIDESRYDIKNKDLDGSENGIF